MVMETSYLQDVPLQVKNINKLNVHDYSPEQIEKIFMHYLNNKKRFTLTEYHFMINYAAQANKNQINNNNSNYINIIIDRYGSMIKSLQGELESKENDAVLVYKFIWQEILHLVTKLNLLNQKIIDLLKADIELNSTTATKFIIYQPIILKLLAIHPCYLKEIKIHLVRNSINLNNFINHYSISNKINYTLNDFYDDLSSELSMGIMI